MREIGEYLHRVREEKNISLKDVQEATKISMRYLEAIDRGEFDGIPGEVYRKGFLVNFATAIGLDGQSVLQKYNELKIAKEEEARQAQTQAAVKKEEPSRNPKPVNITNSYNAVNSTVNNTVNKTVNNTNHINTTPITNTVHTPLSEDEEDQSRGLYLGIVVALIGILIVLSFFLFPNYHKSGLTESTISTTQEDIISESNNKDTKLLPAPITVSAVFKERTWVQIKVDGDYLYGADGMTFDPSQPQQIWTAQKEMVVKMGNPAGLNLTFNGKELGQLGEKGTVKTIKLTRHGLEAP